MGRVEHGLIGDGGIGVQVFVEQNDVFVAFELVAEGGADDGRDREFGLLMRGSSEFYQSERLFKEELFYHMSVKGCSER